MHMRIKDVRAGLLGCRCDVFFGVPLCLMGVTVVAHEPAHFARLMQARLTREQASVAAAAGGARLFDTAGCSACHRIAGTGANGLAGPDLTFVGARRT